MKTKILGIAIEYHKKSERPVWPKSCNLQTKRHEKDSTNHRGCSCNGILHMDRQLDTAKD